MIAVAAEEHDPRPLYVLILEDILRRLVEATDGGADTYEVRELIEEARAALRLPPRLGLPES